MYRRWGRWGKKKNYSRDSAHYSRHPAAAAAQQSHDSEAWHVLPPLHVARIQHQGGLLLELVWRHSADSALLVLVVHLVLQRVLHF